MNVRKRSGNIVAFDKEFIYRAISLAAAAAGEQNEEAIRTATDAVEARLAEKGEEIVDIEYFTPVDSLLIPNDSLFILNDSLMMLNDSLRALNDSVMIDADSIRVDSLIVAGTSTGSVTAEK